jgi:RimJ/RimL family protein N-acetyltransferase
VYEQIRPATPTDFDALIALLDEIAGWLQTKGLKYQWPASFSANEGWLQSYGGWVNEGRVFLARRGDEVVGTFRLTDDDAWAWPEAADETDVCYLHTLGVRRAEAGSGLGGRMLAWAADYAAQQGSRELRLDCDTENERLKQYYLDAGFEFRGEHDIRTVGGLYVARGYVVAKFALALAPWTGVRK